MTPTKHDEIMDRKAAARYIGFAPKTLATWTSTNRYSLPIVKVGRSVRYRKSDLDAFLARQLRP